MTDSLVHRSPIPAVSPQPAMPYAVPSGEECSAPQHRVAIPAKMRFSCSSSFAVEVTAMSLAGFTCDALQSAHPGTLCWLTLPGLGALEAAVVRNGNQGIACSFRNKLNPAVLDHYIAKYQAP
ncbi:PilZ domain-containing protein [Sphingopyxis sp. BSNA05]|uniref:PilZ domain-containing protein n=1 Tax=Sphingopyxis sp. BSNA05 TaxID=1236614 RepID=UPI0015674AE0|nr:PilZ domain-containing protein [Sphingopyxis sp. BSNA05]